MNKESLIQLTNNLYRLTLLFPKKEPLRYKMRELADDILAKVDGGPSEGPAEGGRAAGGLESVNPSSEKLSEEGPLSVFKDLEILDCFFEVVKEQNWVKPADVLATQKEYDNLKQEIKRAQVEKPVIEEKPVAENDLMDIESRSIRSQQPQTLSAQAISERQEKILAFLREQGRAQVWQIKQILPEVTKRTLRRDFESLLKKGVIERIGERNDTFYQIKIVQV